MCKEDAGAIDTFCGTFLSCPFCRRVISVGVSSSGSTSRKAFRLLVNKVAFGLPVRPVCEVNVDRLLFITKRADNFQSILLGDYATDGKAVR